MRLVCAFNNCSKSAPQATICANLNYLDVRGWIHTALILDFFHLSHLGEGLPQLAYIQAETLADNIAGVRIIRELPVPLRNSAHSVAN
jgi:hypothetical protein